MKKSRRLSSRVLLFSILTFIVAVTVIVGVILLQVNSYNTGNSEKQANNGVNGLKTKVFDVLDTATINATFGAREDAIINALLIGDSDNIKNVASVFQKNTETEFFIITDINGKVNASAGIAVDKTDIKNNESVAAALSGKTVSTIESDIMQQLCAVSAAPIKNTKGEIMGAVVAGYTLINESIVDGLKSLYGTDFTVFEGNIRVNTTITKDGQRQIGTTLSNEVAEIVINQGKAYTGEAEILGSQYICSYLSLNNSDGDVIGVLFAGQPLTEAQALMFDALKTALIISIFAVIVILIETTVYLTKVMANPLKKVVKAAEDISEGDLNVSVKIKSNTEIGLLAKSFTDMAEKLRSLIRRVNESAVQITTASEEIASSSTALSQGAVEQAASVEQLSSSVDEIYTMTKSNSDMANNASKLSEKAKNKCVEGNTSMRELLTAMNDISLSSNRISKIIKVIDDIAFQTNILSLNAAVEAAQAGQYSKGFAVVADNVKQLASRSADAASEIAEMIEESNKISKNGSDMASVTAEKLSEVLDIINEMDSLIIKISGSSEEQTKGIAQINIGIGEISNVMQTNSAMSEESTASGIELSRQAKVLKEQVEAFKF